ncbi:unnamed protein product [Caenorhabditis angaria]|uniref:G-protein coupled receptors family 1 profile domain-containing protein n=1 Tax=Caenorhabditis angaria TaxID=860376 RepID=A0A9P1N5J5_9PELO|nr:unnamed protein product [Caenorhabditis angaria]
MDVIFKIYMRFTGTLAVFLNLTLLFLSVFKSPQVIKNYSILIINFALTDLLASLASIFVEPRMIPSGYVVAHINYGICNRFSSSVCYMGYAFMFHLFIHSQYSLLVSFAYRYYILVKETPKVRSIIFILLISYIPSLIQFISFYVNEGDPFEIYNAINSDFPEYQIQLYMISGNLDIRKGTSSYTLFQATFAPLIIYLIIIRLRSKIIVILKDKSEHMRAETKSMHRKLLQVLTYQACLPGLFVLGIASFSIEQCNVYKSPAIEFSVHMFFELVPLLSPIIYLYYITPYRLYITSIFGKNLSKESNVFQSATHDRGSKVFTTSKNINN